MSASKPASERPAVSIIVPARNEEACLGPCLESLVAQGGVTREILVVDDGSTDGTRQIAQSFPDVQVVDPRPLPPGWTGKNNAMASGAAAARGKWLLFTDADTVHRPGSLARTLIEAEGPRAALLSYSPEQELHGVLQKAVMPVIFAELASTYQPSQVSNPKSMAAAANGQYLLVSREAYDAVGGHRPIASNLLEDVALARAVKLSGRKILFRYGGDAVRTRMYRSFSQLAEGWTKNLALLFPSPLRLAILRLVEFVVILGSGALAFSAASAGRWPVAVMLGAVALILYALFLKRILKAHSTWDATVLSLIGLPPFSYLLVRSWISHKRGSVQWKGRNYATAGSSGTGQKPTGVVPGKAIESKS